MGIIKVIGIGIIVGFMLVGYYFYKEDKEEK